MSRGTFFHFFYLSLFACVALAGCASTENAAPVVDRTAVRTETKPVERRSNDDRGPQSSSQSAKTGTNSDGAAKSSNKNTSSETQASNRNAQTETQSAAKRPTESAKETAPQQNSQSASKPYRAGDWRPEYHTVRKGDTLYSIALDFGQDYRDLARWNALADPSYIQIGQQLRLFPAGGRGAIPRAASATVGKSPPGAEQIPTFSDPKAFRVIYSEQAYAELQRVLAGETETAVVQSKAATVQQPAQTAKAASAGAPKSTQTGLGDKHISWEWPAPGKVLYEFSAGPNKKGVSIQGKAGQAVVSSAPGKVVYSGSGLRGYGNLIIIKHNATYLSVYAHNSQLLVREGQMVAQGQKIAVMGKAAGATTALHFEIRRLGKPIDPRSQLPARAS